MKIKNITLKRNSFPLKVPFVTALRTATSVEEIMVTLTTDTGLMAEGAAVAVTAVTGETLESIETTILNKIKPKILGSDVHEQEYILTTIQECTKGNPSAKAAVDIAVYNLLAAHKKVPLYEFLGGSPRKLITDVTISLNDIETMIKDSKDAVANGFHILKIKVGSGNQTDIDRVHAVANAVGNSVALRIDANQAWDPESAIGIIKEFEAQQLNIDLIEQPVKARDYVGLKKVTDAVNTTILADESVFSAKDAEELLKMQAVDMLSIKLLKTGGIYPALKLINIAETYQTECMLSCMLEGPIGIDAACHLACAYPNTITRIDLDAVFLGAYNIDKNLLGLQNLIK